MILFVQIVEPYFRIGFHFVWNRRSTAAVTGMVFPFLKAFRLDVECLLLFDVIYIAAYVVPLPAIFQQPG